MPLKTVSISKRMERRVLSDEIDELEDLFKKFLNSGQMYMMNPFDKALQKKRNSRMKALLNKLPDEVGTLIGFNWTETRYPSKKHWNREMVANHIQNQKKKLNQLNQEQN